MSAKVHLPVSPDTAEQWPYLAQHITEPRKSCEGLPRKHAPKPKVNTPAPLPCPSTRRRRAVRLNKDTQRYGVRDVGYGRYRVMFRYDGADIRVGGVFTDLDAAARAHDDYVRATGIERPLNFGNE